MAPDGRQHSTMRSAVKDFFGDCPPDRREGRIPLPMRTFLLCGTFLGLLTPAGDPGPVPPPDISLRKEVERAYDRGCAWLLSRQSPEGFWSDPDHPALTALPLRALAGDPAEHHRAARAPALERGYRFLFASARPDGGIYRIPSLVNYNTAVSLVALIDSGDPAHRDILRAARRFLIRGQQDRGEPGETDHPLDGGIGYGSSHTHSDLSNTLLALEALHATRHLVRDAAPEEDRLDWEAAIRFVQNCQNLPATNPLPWASDDPENRGGFVYFPGSSKAGETILPDGRIALRSYGSMSYAGLLSFIYAEMEPGDRRVKAVMEWLGRNYTLEENPGMGRQGLYYYYHTLAKALDLSPEPLLSPEGERIPWARDLALRLLQLQRSDGRWENDNGRWWEKDPNLSTSYTLLALARLHPHL